MLERAQKRVALDLMENKTFLEKLKFGIGDGNLQYYLYNWKCPSMGAEKVCTFWARPPPRSPAPPQTFHLDRYAVGVGWFPCREP